MVLGAYSLPVFYHLQVSVWCLVYIAAYKTIHQHCLRVQVEAQMCCVTVAVRTRDDVPWLVRHCEALSPMLEPETRTLNISHDCTAPTQPTPLSLHHTATAHSYTPLRTPILHAPVTFPCITTPAILPTTLNHTIRLETRNTTNLPPIHILSIITYRIMAQISTDDHDEETTPLSPRVSDVSNGSRYMAENDFMVSPPDSPASVVSGWSESKRGGKWNGKVRHAVGIALLLATVFLWTASNFLASVCISQVLCPEHMRVWSQEEIWMVRLERVCADVYNRPSSQTTPTRNRIS